MKTIAKRSAFTLVEMLIVLGVIATVAAIFIPIVLNMTDRNQVPKGASLLENALSVAKSKAISDKRPHGIRLNIAPSSLRTTASGVGMAWYNQLQYIEIPPDYTERWVWSNIGTTVSPFVLPFWSTRFADCTTSPVGFDSIPVPDMSTIASLPTVSAAVRLQLNNTYGVPPNTNAPYNFRRHILFCPIVTSTGWTGISGTTHLSPATNFQYNDGSPDLVFAGDSIELNGTGEIYKIIYVSTGSYLLPDSTPASGVPRTSRVHYLILDRPLTNEVLTPTNGTSNFRVIRSPRVIASLPTIDLPQDVVLDFNPTFLVGGVRNAKDTSGTIYMSGVGNGNSSPSGTGSGVQTSEITGLTTTTAGLTAPLFIDIMFSPTGEIIATSQNGGLVGAGAGFSVGQSGLIALWLHSRGDPNIWAARQITAAQGNADNQAIVAINGRTGFIGSYPVAPLNVTTDPLANARIGKARISADTGQ